MEQGTAEWHLARLGKATASRVADIVARTKTGYSASRANYAAELVAERLTGTPTEGFKNAAMVWGSEQEAAARSLYSFVTDVDVEEVGFVDHPTIAMAGASPDGLVGEDGLVEIKAPNTATHIETLLSPTVPGKYMHQMQWQMACTGRKWCDWVSYDPRLPTHMQILILRVERDAAAIAALEKEVTAFLAEVDATVGALRARYEEAA